jgi:hypothetical protein
MRVFTSLITLLSNDPGFLTLHAFSVSSKLSSSIDVPRIRLSIEGNDS